MENHPIPQDITGFEFKLIGDMTIKQFAYVAGGVVSAFVTYISPLPDLIKIPLALIFVGIGAAFAFLPIEGRPMDLMFKNFFKAVFSPTQYVYRKAGSQLFTQGQTQTAASPTSKPTTTGDKQLKDFLNALPKRVNKLDQKETVFFQSLGQYANANPAQNVPGFVAEHSFARQGAAAQLQPLATTAQTPTGKSDNSIAVNQDLLKTAAVLEKELRDAKAKEAAQPQIDSSKYLGAHQKALELQGNLNDLLLQKQQLETRLVDMQRKMESQGKAVFSPSMARPAAPQTQLVRSIPQGMQKGVGLPITPEFPNIITGIVKDPRGNPLPNILVEVKDSQGNAVRAFKTNALGQFASATALTNGDYTIEFEDTREQNKFVTTTFKAGGEIILPIEVFSVDTREELRRSLFN
jgi:hypothetical protein